MALSSCNSIAGPRSVGRPHDRIRVGPTAFCALSLREKLPLIYGLFPLEWLFQTLDLGIFLVFIFRGILAADRELRKQ
jgi:hypothetical protein